MTWLAFEPQGRGRQNCFLHTLDAHLLPGESQREQVWKDSLMVLESEGYLEGS